MYVYMDVSKNRGVSPKIDGENNGKPYSLMDVWGGLPIFGNTYRYHNLCTRIGPTGSP